MIETAVEAVSEAAVVDALRGVRDPELDESIVDLEFVEQVRVDDDRVHITLRLPTFWCAPNFSYLMAFDARQAALSVPGVRSVRVELRDNAYSEEISDGVSAGRGFERVFEGQAEGEDLDELRELFRAKSFGMRQEQLLRFLIDQGLSRDDVVRLRLQDVIDTSDEDGLRVRVGGTERLLRGGAPLARRYLERRPPFATDLLVTDARGRPVSADELDGYLREGRSQRISITFNTMMCRGLLETRYGVPREAQRSAGLERRESL